MPPQTHAAAVCIVSAFETRSTCTWHSLTSIKAAHGANIYFSSRTGMCHAHTLLDISNNHNGPANAALAHTHGRAPALARLKHAFVQYVTAAAEGVEISVPLPFVELRLSLLTAVGSIWKLA